MKLIEILSINLKYYRMHYNLSQEKFAEVLGTSLSYLNGCIIFSVCDLYVIHAFSLTII